MFDFAWAWVWLLSPLPLLALYGLPAAKARSSALRVPFFGRIAGLGVSGQSAAGSALWQKAVLLLIWLLCVAAAARPQWAGDPVPLTATGRDLMLAVDYSGSMEIADMQIQNRQMQRIDVAKYVLTDFIQRRQGDRVGLILFGSHAYLQAPLTFDLKTVETLLMEAQIGFAGQQTAIGDAIGLAVKRLRFGDLIMDRVGDIHTESAAEQFDVDFTIMTGELARFLPALGNAFGGIETE